VMDSPYSYFIEDLILLDKNVFNNGKSERDLYQVHVGDKIIDRNNISRRLNSKILSEYRDINSKFLSSSSIFK
jgi:hypothetical protein